jgi:hypothetical protein
MESNRERRPADDTCRGIEGLEKCSRFLKPILNQTKAPIPAQANQLEKDLDPTDNSAAARAARREVTNSHCHLKTK